MRADEADRLLNEDGCAIFVRTVDDFLVLVLLAASRMLLLVLDRFDKRRLAFISGSPPSRVDPRHLTYPTSAANVFPVMSPFSLRLFAAGLLAIPLGVGAQTGLPKQSPFAPPGGAQAVVAANETLEFAGVSSMGRRTDLIIHDKTAKRKHWIGIGETVDGISVVRYDSANEQATVRVNGAEKVLVLRKPTRTAGSPAPVAAVPTGFNVPPPVTAVPPPSDPAQFVQKVQAAPPPDTAAPAPAPTPAAPQTPAAQAKAETEARMLVSDLLEIGMAQRKAYEEAQRKSAGGGTEQTPPAGQPPSQTQTPVPGAPPTAPTSPNNE